jgi:hypothetical protein
MTMEAIIEGDRVRKHTSAKVNQKLDREREERVQYYTSQPREVIEKRLEELNYEWDIERWLETNASSLALLGISLGVTANKKWFWLSAVVLPFLFQHAVQGWCPPVPIMRRLGIRTQQEIDAEKYALRSLLEKATIRAME